MTIRELAEKAAELVASGTTKRADLKSALSDNPIAAAHAVHCAMRLGYFRYQARTDSYKMVRA